MIEGTVDILLVEDNPDDAQLTLLSLRHFGIARPIGVARDGAEAIDYLFRTGVYAQRSQHNPKLILLDLNLPRINGLDVLRRVKSHPDTQMIPVVIFTSSREERDVIAGYRLGTNSYVVKPIDFDQITDVVRQLGTYWVLHNEPPAPV